MKLLFRGWQREVTHHHHDVIPVTQKNGSYNPDEGEDSLTWDSALVAYGKLENVALNGAFLIEFNFDQKELRAWLVEFTKSKPEAAVKLLAEMQGRAIVALAKKTEERLSKLEVNAADEESP